MLWRKSLASVSTTISGKFRLNSPEAWIVSENAVVSSEHAEMNASMCVPSSMSPCSQTPLGQPPSHWSPPPTLQTAIHPHPKTTLVHIPAVRELSTSYSKPSSIRRAICFVPKHSKSSTSWRSSFGTECCISASRACCFHQCSGVPVVFSSIYQVKEEQGVLRK